jgi:hypothetical protein
MKLIVALFTTLAVVSTVAAASLPSAPASGMPTLSVSPYT